MIKAQVDHPDSLETFILRPAFVLKRDNALGHNAMGKTYSVRVDHLAATTLDAVINGGEKQILQNDDVVEKGQRLLKDKATLK